MTLSNESDPLLNSIPSSIQKTDSLMNDEEAANDGNGSAYTLDEALEALGFGKFQLLVLLYAGLGSMAEAMEVMILSFVGPSVKSEWGLSSAQESLITTVVFAGMLIGAYSWGLISDNYGRRTGLLSVAVVTSTCTFLSSFSQNYISLVMLRMVGGIGLGGGPVYTSWFLEFVPAQNRGAWMVINSTFWTLGTIVEASLAWIIVPRLGWRWLLAVSSVPSIIALLFYSLTIESPRYFYLNGRIGDAYNVLKKMESMNATELPSGMLVYDQMDNMDEEFPPSEDTQLLSTGRSKFISIFSPIVMLLSSKLLRTTLLMWVVYFGNSFAYYGVVLLSSELSSEQSTCGSSILHTKILKDDTLFKDVFITSLAEVPGLILSALTVDKFGRKISMALMYALGFIFLLPLIFHQNDNLNTILLSGARMCFLGTFTVAGVYCPEVYPTSVRTTGAGVASSIGRIAGMISPLVAVGLVNDCNQMAAIILLEAVIILSGICVLFFPVETKGMKLHETFVGNN